MVKKEKFSVNFPMPLRLKPKIGLKKLFLESKKQEKQKIKNLQSVISSPQTKKKSFMRRRRKSFLLFNLEIFLLSENGEINF